MKIKLRRGQKLCPKCNTINAARQHICKNCKYNFFARSMAKRITSDWKEIEIGAYIKIVNGTGPYFICKRDSENCNAGERICMGNTGVYKVVGKDKNGLHVHGASASNGGYSYLYMGEPYYSEQTGLHYEPYKIKKVKRGRRK